MNEPAARRLFGCLAFVVITIGPASAQTTPTPAATPPPLTPPACTAPEHRQFDFWIGYWDVYPTGKPKLVAHSLIEKLYDGCGIRENWLPLKGSGGGSLNSYDSQDKKWRQVWIDNSNGWGDFEGNFASGAMVLSGIWKNFNGPNTKGYTRTTWSKNADGSVRQHGELRSDDGKSWSDTFDFTYKPSKDPLPK